jgi:hypothetical protein
VAQLYKTEYRRYGVQLPIPLADEIDRLVKAQPQTSASTVIVEFVTRGMLGYGTCSKEEMYQLQSDQAALLRAGPLALTVLYGEESKRAEAAHQLAELISNSIMRKPTTLVAKSGAPAVAPAGEARVAVLAKQIGPDSEEILRQVAEESQEPYPATKPQRRRAGGGATAKATARKE